MSVAPLRMLWPPMLALVFLQVGCEPKAAAPIADQSVRPARIFQVTASGSTRLRSFVGRVEASQTVDVSFEVSGPLAQLPVREGQEVNEGALIAALDPTEFELALREAEVQQKLARRDLTRKAQLLRDRGISRSLVDDARSLFDLQTVRVQKARERLLDSKIVAPFDAYVARRFTDNHVNVNAGQKIARLTDLEELFVVASIPEGLLATVTSEQVISVFARFDFAPDQRFPLDFREISGEADAVAQTYEVAFAMPRPERWNVLPGMSATIDVELTASEAPEDRGIGIPVSALVSDIEGGFFVWIYDSETLGVSKRRVRVGVPDGRGVAVLEGLAGNELIVATGATALREGMRVRVLGEPVTTL